MVNESLPQTVWAESFAGFSCLPAVFACIHPARK
jgi:hypothetical protein